MTGDSPYALEDLAEAFGLTERTARYYIGSLLPPRHKTGRGRQARYGQETWNCFAFIRKARERKFTNQQVAGMLATLSQRQVDKVADGRDTLAIVPIPVEDGPAHAEESADRPRWQLLYADDDLQIAHRGSSGAAQRDLVRLTATLLARILRP